MKMKKRFLSVLLSLVMVLGLMPGMSLSAYADDPYASIKNTTTVIKFDGKDWYLIDYDVSTVTLLATDCVDASAYNSYGNFVEYSNNPTVKTVVDDWYTSNITADAKKAVSGNAMFLLTTDQANAITSADVRKCSNAYGDGWWLCSQGDFGYTAYVKSGSGDVDGEGNSGNYPLGVRPALKLDLSKVTFDSATKTFSMAGSTTPAVTISPSADAGTVKVEEATLYHSYPDYWVLTATAAEGYRFLKWTFTYNGSSGQKFENPYNLPKDSVDKITGLTAVFEADKESAIPATVTANNRTYDGTEKPLVTVTGTPTGGEMQYALGTATEATEQYTTSIPAKTDAGTYYVWYKVVSDTNHNDTEPKCVTVNIAQNESESETEKQTESETEKQTESETEKQDPIPSGGGGGSIPQATTPVTIPAETVEEPTKEELQVPASIFLNSGFLVSWSGSKVRVSWGSVPEADHYEIYANYCGNKSCVRVASVSGATSAILKKLNGKKIKTKKIVKAYVIAYKNGVAIGRTILGHAAGPKSAYTNAKAVSVDQSAYQLKAGETAKVSATITKAKRNKKLPGINHGAKLRYASTNEGVATVDGNGVITAVGSGTCEVWIYALNGRSAKVTVNVN